MAGILRSQASSEKPWKVPVVAREDRVGVAILTIRRPAVLNAINADVTTQLRENLDAIREDESVEAVVLTGYGKKAFVSGADIGYLSKLDSEDTARGMCLDFQGAIQEFEDFPKPVICAINGVAYGGGCEIAMGCHARVAPAGAKALLGQPEVNLGIIPGAGGTQRLPRIVDFGVAAEMLRTGRPISSERALEIGLVDRLSNGDVVDEAVALARKMVAGEDIPRKINTEAMNPPGELDAIELGHLSKAVDEVLCRVIVEGARMTLAEGLKHEAQLFSEVCKTEDSRIGLKNFMTKGARSKAEFVHR